MAIAARARRSDCSSRCSPIHYGAYEAQGLYENTPDPLDRLRTATDRILLPRLGEPVTV